MSKIKNGWKIFIASFKVAEHLRSVWYLIVSSTILQLLLFTKFSLIIYFFGSGSLPGSFSEFSQGISETLGNADENTWVFIGIGILYLYLSLWLMTFFNFGTSYVILNYFKKGEKKNHNEAIKFAFSRVKDVSVWALVLTTVNIILQIINSIAERLGKIGEIILKIINSLLGAAWSLLTIFVVPIYVENENVSVKSALKTSKDIFIKTWGETLVSSLSVSFFGALLIFGVTVTVSFVVVLSNLWFLIPIAILIVLLTVIIVSTIDRIYKIILYIYASTGRIPEVLVNKEYFEKKLNKKEKYFDSSFKEKKVENNDVLK